MDSCLENIQGNMNVTILMGGCHGLHMQILLSVNEITRTYEKVLEGSYRFLL